MPTGVQISSSSVSPFLKVGETSNQRTRNVLTNTQHKIRCGNDKSDAFETDTGVPQGDWHEKASEGNLLFLDCIISLNEKREIKTKVYRKPTHTYQYTHVSSNQPLHVKLATIENLVRRAKFACSDQTSLNEEISYIRKTMQLNGYPLNVVNKTIKDTLESHNSEHKSKELEPLTMFIPYEEGVAKKLKRVGSKYGFTTVFTKTKDLRGEIQTKG